ncbi:MAG: hypothetical protein JO110_11840 [Acetobacteraceae bacterium]|nr:hypothetical protein [Acetobacteraceae bacterium]
MGARRVFGSGAAYAVCVNGLAIRVAQARVGDVASLVEWRRVHGDDIPRPLLERLDAGLAEGAAWKFAPLRLFPQLAEIALDNDLVLWRMPEAIARWLEHGSGGGPCVIAADMVACFGQFTPLCGPEPRNTGLRGMPPGFDAARALAEVLELCPDAQLRGEVDEQGLQVAILSRPGPPLVVTTEEVSICSPFPGHARSLGTCGAHFVGLNMRQPRPQYGCDAAVLERIAANWDELRPHIERHVGTLR